MEASVLIREARRSKHLTQRELAEAMGTDQSAVARLERAGANPRLSTLQDALAAAGFAVDLRLVELEPSVDESQIASRLRLSPAERLATFQASNRSLGRLVSRARRVQS
jgi:transcriptional regulator with XRE-family HTH domain